MRAVEKKRPPFMTPKRWIWLSVAIFVTLAVWFGLYFRDIQSPRWSEFETARQNALDSGELASIEEMYKHVWEKTTWIAEGSSEDGNLAYLFQDEEKKVLAVVDGQSVASKEALEAKFKADHPDAELLRISPGMFREAPVWEVYYRFPDNGNRRHAYNFYTFDAKADLLETYKLTTKTGP
ncbi:hypothetical protein ACFQZE_02930 [Paenibacillus sp. GCM10027627]|uniref:hypothetical protein n=1 Tax=unclassified Paenibacillus TaxID=185978 RepID=UPI003629E31F